MMRIDSSRSLLLVVAFTLCFSPISVFAAGGGYGGVGSADGNKSSARGPERFAERDYNRGLRRRDSALKHEARAISASSEKKRDKQLSKAVKDWSAAEKYYRAAIKQLPKYYQAHSSLGYTLRKLGRYDKAIASYDLALKLKPGYPEALEYRAEAYLALGRFEDASHSYTRLRTLDREKAGQLLSAMEVWLEAHETSAADGTSISPETVAWLRGWVEEQSPGSDAETRAVSSPGADWDR